MKLNKTGEHRPNSVAEVTVHDANNSLTIDPAAKTESPSFWSRFSPSAVASRITGLFAAYCSVPKAMLSAYHCVVETFFPSNVNYSKELVRIEDDPQNPIEIPTAGSFQGGAKLCAQMGEEISEAAVDFLNKGDQSMNQFKADIFRTTTFEVIHPIEGQGNIANKKTNDFSIDTQQEDNSIYVLNELTGKITNGAYVTQAIASIANQTLGNTCNLLYANVKRPSQTGVEQPKFFEVGKAGGFFSPSAKQANGENAIIKYSLEKKRSLIGEDYFILKYENQAASKGYFKRNESDSSSPSEVVPLFNEELRPTVTTMMSFRITPNKKFNSDQDITKDNMPVFIECLDFSNEYIITPKSGVAV